jgi:hypothetical protein
MFPIPKLEDVLPLSKPWPEDFGINRATTFYGFCGYHDNELFEPIDALNPVPSIENAGLLAFRTFAREIYTKQAALEAFEKHLKQQDLSDAQRGYCREHIKGSKKGLSDLLASRQPFQDAVISGDWSAFDYHWTEFDGVPAIGVSGGFSPEFDFDGTPLQSLLQDKSMELLFVNVLPSVSGTSTSAVFTWLKSSGAARKFVRSFDALEDLQKGTGIVCLSFEHLENVAFPAKWWEGLRTTQKSCITQRHKRGSDPDEERNSTCLKFGTRKYVDWTVANCVSSVSE